MWSVFRGIEKHMAWVTGAAIYFIIWWMTLFLVLPFGVRRDSFATIPTA